MGSPLSGTPLSCREAAAALALVTAATERRCHVIGFTGEGSSRWKMGPAAVSPLPALHAGASVAEAVQAVSDLPFGPTDCALPMLYALEQRLAVDVFVVLTDNETWCGDVHPAEALRRYRSATGLDAKLAVVGFDLHRLQRRRPAGRGDAGRGRFRHGHADGPVPVRRRGVLAAGLWR